MTEATAFLDIVKNLLVICCLMATLASTCRQEQTSDRLNAQLSTLQVVSDGLQTVAAPADDRNGGAE